MFIKAGGLTLGINQEAYSGFYYYNGTKSRYVAFTDMKGVANGIASLDANIKVPIAQIPDLSSIYLTSHQSIKTLNTNNTTTQAASVSEAIAGSGTINLHKVSKTGSYNDLLDKPTIPTVNDAMLTIQQNGTTVSTFTANASSNVTANIITGVKELTAGTNIDNIREEGTFFIKNPTGTLPISPCTWCIITQEKCYDSYGTYWYVQNGKFSYLTTMGVNQLTPWQLYIRQISDYTYMQGSDWASYDIASKTSNIALSADNATYSMNLYSVTGRNNISTVTLGLKSDKTFTTISSLELTGYAQNNLQLFFKTGTSFTLSIIDYTENLIINYSLLSNYEWKINTLYKIDFTYLADRKLYVTIEDTEHDSIPNQTGNSGKFLTTNGTTMSWANASSVKFREWSD